MRPGYALYIHRSAYLIVGRTSALLAAMFFSVVLATQAQESIEEVALPPWSEPTLPSSELAPSTQAAAEPSAPEPLPPAPEPLSSTPAESFPSSSEPLPSSEQAFPSSPGLLSLSTNYTTASTTVVPPPVATGPYGRGGSYDVFPAGERIYPSGRNFHWELSLTVRGVWDDNVFLSHTNKTSGYYVAIEPYISIGVGDTAGRNTSYLQLAYMPSGLVFTDHGGESAFNQLIFLSGGYSSGRLTLTFSEYIALLQSANLNSFWDTTGLWANTDASGPTRMNIFYTSLTANYALTPKISLQAEFYAPSYAYPGNISNYTVSQGLYVYYEFRPKLSVGIGGTFGYNWVDEPSTDQTFEQVNLRLTYQWTSKVGLYASGGVEFRQFDGNRNTYDTPVFEVGLSYNPFSGTFISLAGGRRIYNSGYLANQDFASTYVAGRIQQRLFHRFYLGLGAGYENSDYFATDRDVNATRGDQDYWFIEPSVDVLITRWLSAGVYYLHRESSSNDDFFSWEDNQVGVRATVRF